MLYLYRILLLLARPILVLGGLFIPKLRQRNRGLKQQEVVTLAQSIWIHSASLGEFEQGKPVIDELKKTYPNIPLVLTFFSSSGYEKRKDYELADFVYYMPYDNKNEIAVFIDKIQPLSVIFIKYEFWFTTLQILKNRGVDYYFVSAVFRDKHFFFQHWAKSFLRIIGQARLIFVQDLESKLLIEKNKTSSVMVAGDTRIDRVLELSQQEFNHPIIQSFTEDTFTVIAGSTWHPDEKLLLSAIASFPDWKWIIAPHEISTDHIDSLVKSAGSSVQLLSKFDKEKEAKILILDSIGILSRIYRYGQIAYIGGGFGSGIHNTLEPVGHKLPVIYGPKFEKFQEAVAFLNRGIGRSINNELELIEAFRHFSKDDIQKRIQEKIQDYLLENAGATQKIVREISIDIDRKLSSGK